VASERLIWGVLGADTLTRHHVLPALFQADGARLVAIADAEYPDAAALAAEFGVERGYRAYQALLDDQDVDCVYIALPGALRRDWALRAAEAGKHVLCAPPLGLDVAELDEMDGACLAAGVALMEGLAPQFHPRMARLRDLLDRQVVGDLTHLTAEFGAPLRVEADGRALLETDGALQDLGGSCIAALRALVGAEPITVTASAEFDPVGAAIDMEGFLEFPNGVTAQLVCSLISARATEWLAVGGERGAISVPHPAFTAGPSDAAPICIHLIGAPELEVLPGAPVDPYHLMIEAFSQAVLHGEPAPYPMAESRANRRALDALALSARTGRTVRPALA
jgi:xylose dehydrogenase (NAD/NADP)